VWDKITQGWSKNTHSWYHNDGVLTPETGDRYIFVLFAGRIDKNKVELHDGDILKTFHFRAANRNGGIHYLHHVICWNDKTMTWAAISLSNYIVGNCSTSEAGNIPLWVYINACNNGEFEKIGDVFTNPELLEIQNDR